MRMWGCVANIRIESSRAEELESSRRDHPSAVLLLSCSSALFENVDFLHERPQERLYVRNESQRLEAAAVAELDDRRWIDVDADDFNPRGQQVSDSHRVEHRRDHQAVRDIVDGGAHLPVGLQPVRYHVRQRTVVADAAGEEEVDAMLNAFVHDARREPALVDGRADRPAAAYPVNGSQMMFVAGGGDTGIVEMDAEARAERGLLDVVRSRRIARKELVDVPAADQFTNSWPSPRVNDGRAADDQRFAALLAVR